MAAPTMSAPLSSPVAVAEHLVLRADLDPFLGLRALAAYSGLGVRTLRGHLHRGEGPLPHYQIGGRVLVRRSEYDAWVQQFHRAGGGPAVDTIARTVDEVLAGLTAAPRRADTRAPSSGRR